MYHAIIAVLLLLLVFGVFSIGGNLGLLTRHNLRFQPDGATNVVQDVVAGVLPIGEPILVQFSTAGVSNTLVFCGTNPVNGALLLDIHDVPT